ncbi:MAG TPA: topoisomerase C-terminal repeat-containing protein, partial [Xanthobacteraceae bacterium]
LTLYQEGHDDDEEDEESKRLPEMKTGEPAERRAILSSQHFTEPPPRFSEASLVKRMEELGIGRPSTYASVLQVLRDRGYVRLDKKRLIPEDKGRVVIAFLEAFFMRYVEYDFTADLEEKLDKIANAEIDWREVLRDFWKDFIAAVDQIKDVRLTQVIDALDEMLAAHVFPPRADGVDPRVCPQCGTGRLNLKIGRFGGFVGCSNYPECRYTRQLMSTNGAGATRVLGKDPETGLEVTQRDGRFGPYVQLGENSETGKKDKKDEKPKRAGLPKDTEPASVDLEQALKLLALPREIGPHPETHEPIMAGIGRFGTYVKHKNQYANLEPGDDVLVIGLNRAVTLLAEKAARGPGRGRGRPSGRPLGDHPTFGGPVTQHEGRFGPYVSHGKVNATIPVTSDPANVTLDEAVELIAARAEKLGTKPPKKLKAAKTTAKKPAKRAKNAKKKPDAKEAA